MSVVFRWIALSSSYPLVARLACLLGSLCIVGLVVSTNNSGLYAQDPTKPSSQILERLHSGVPEAVATNTERRTMPTIKIKAIVMRDKDNGIALLDINGRKVRLNLERSALPQTLASDQISEAVQPTSPLGGLEIEGVFYRVEEFTPHSILLNAQGHKLLVK